MSIFPEGSPLSPTLPDRPAQLPATDALLAGLGISRRSRFPVHAAAEAPAQARTVARTVLHLMLGTGEGPERTSRRVQTCLAELVAIAYTRTTAQEMVCAVWMDAEHVFLSVEHDQALPQAPDDSTLGLHLVKTIADDYGTHFTEGMHQTWAAVRHA